MRYPTLKLKALLFGFCYTLVSCVPVWADDTEIYFGSSISQSGAAIRPNVLLVLDTSSSMTSTVSGTGMSRLDNMKQALHAILDNANNINVGLMRFHKQGGPVLYPVSYIDQDVCEIEACADGSSLAIRVADSADDAEQDSTGAVTLDSATLELVSDPTLAGAQTTTVEVYVGVQNDDVEETSSSGNMYYDSSDLELSYDDYNGGEQLIGLRFQSVAVPQGAVVTSAQLEFTVDEAGAGSVSLDIYGNARDNAPQFSNGQKVSTRARVQDLLGNDIRVDWDNIPNAAVGQKLVSPNISAIVQAIVNRSAWGSGNNMVFMLEKDPAAASGNSNKRVVGSFTAGGNNRPLLRITYVTGVGLSDVTQTVGLRFTDVQIPQGATITSAYLELEAQTTNTDVTTLAVRGEANDSAAAFSSSANNITSRPTTTSTVAWANIAAWNTPGEKIQSPDIAAIVQEIVNRSGWCGGNDLALVITGSGQRTAVSFDGAPGGAPLLQVSYDPDSIPSSGGCLNQTVVRRVAAGNDDAEENLSGADQGVVNYGSSDLELVTDSVDQLVGIRFQNVSIPQGATILEADLELEIDEAGSGPLSLRISGQAHDDAAAFTTNNTDISGRAKTSASVTWNSIADPAIDAKLTTPDLAAVVQEIVNRSGWASGNDMVFLIEKTGGSGKRVVESYDGEAVAAPRLRVKIQWNAGDSEGALFTVRQRLKQVVDALQYKSGTPMIDTMYEATRYYRGEGVLYGRERGPSSDRSRSEYTRVSHPASYTGGTVVRESGCTDANLNAAECISEHIDGSPVYKSPIIHECQANYMVVLSDGYANNNNSVDEIQALPGLGGCTAPTSGPGSGGTCGIELTRYLYEQDQSDIIDDTQRISTYTIGFNFSDPWLEDVAIAGGGSFYEASDAAELTSVFQNIIAEILKQDTTYVAPGIAVNQFNRLTHRAEIYFSVFKTDDQPKWPGNLKEYKVSGDPPVIVDQNGNPAVDAVTGFFRNTAHSFWSTDPDGSEVAKGGAAENLTESNRKVYTNSNGAATDVSLYLGSNALRHSNNDITKAVLGIESESDAYRTDLLKWARGVDVLDFDDDGDTSETRLQLGDPLHSRPVIVSYGGTEASPDLTIFFATNEGFLHAVDPDDGSEVFSFIPWELLPNLDAFYRNSSSFSHPYGLDGPLTIDVVDSNHDGSIQGADGDHAHLYVGMRRGGRSYYALDVSDRNTPKLRWVINNGTSGFAELGQTWSKAIKTRVRIESTVKDVLIFGGGYDEDQDTHITRTADQQGRAIFIVDASDGSLLWSGGPAAISPTETFSDMSYSIPAEIRVLDLNGDELADQMYVGDMGGQLWRFDIYNGSSIDELVEGAVIADFGGTAAADNRRFYNAPSLALVRGENGVSLALTIGSGWRAHPLDSVVQDRFYMIRDLSLSKLKGAAYPTKLTESDLYNATENLIQDGTTAEALVALAGKKGWLIQLENQGEKVLSEGTIINYQVLFTTYSPDTSVVNNCRASVGTGRFYLVDLMNASATQDLDGSHGGGGNTNHRGGALDSVDSTLTKQDRSLVLKNTGIPPEPVTYVPAQVLSSDTASPIVLVGPEQVPINFGDLIQRTYWREITALD